MFLFQATLKARVATQDKQMAKLAGRILHTKPDQHRPAPVSLHKFICSIVSLPDVMWVNDMGLVARKPVFGGLGTTQAQTSLHEFEYRFNGNPKDRSSRYQAHIMWALTRTGSFTQCCGQSKVCIQNILCALKITITVVKGTNMLDVGNQDYVGT